MKSYSCVRVRIYREPDNTQLQHNVVASVVLRRLMLVISIQNLPLLALSSNSIPTDSADCVAPSFNIIQGTGVVMLASSNDFLTGGTIQFGPSASFWSPSGDIRSGNRNEAGTATLTDISIAANMVGMLTLKYQWFAGFCRDASGGCLRHETVCGRGQGSAPSLEIYVGTRRVYTRDFVLNPDFPEDLECGGSLTNYSPDPSAATFQLKQVDVGQSLKLKLIGRERNLHIKIYEISVDMNRGIIYVGGFFFRRSQGRIPRIFIKSCGS